MTQSLAIVLNFYRRSLTTHHIFENLLEISILFLIFVFSLLYGQVLNGVRSGFVVPIGYENTRIAIFIVVLVLAMVTSGLTKTLLPLSLIPAAAISLPSLEKVMGSTFPWFFVATLIFLLGRSIKIGVSSLNAIKTRISALSVIQAVDTLQTGVLFSENDGHTLLTNHQMQSLMLAITGKIFRNSRQFYDVLGSDQQESEKIKAELDGQMVYLLLDGTAWMFAKTDIPFRRKNYVHISAADVSELWKLTSKLKLQDQELRHKSAELKKTIANLHVLSKKWEIENARMRAHDILGQRLTVLLRTIQNEQNLDYDSLTLLSKGLLDELKAGPSITEPYDELKSIQQIFNAIGVDIRFEGKLPVNADKAGLFVDIIRESSTNAVRHGFATQINIKAEPTENVYNLTINNNGHTTTSPITPGSGIGTIRKKVGALGGNLDIIHHPMFTLSVVLPRGDQHE